ncbi:TldD/PmbA family protein [Candidatus Bipolaricaulota bacterium]|nr:TldD/PmbA family protein [Candidatus Bipolaricaulota bacterium]
MKELLARLLSESPHEYADIRFERNCKTRIRFEGPHLRGIADYETSGGHVRAYEAGGKSIASFTDPKDAAPLLASCKESARLAARHRNDRLRLAPAPRLEGSFVASPTADPRRISLEEKQALLRHYNSLILAEPHVVTTVSEYEEFYSHRTFVNSEGSSVDYDLLIVNIAGFIVTQRNGVAQRVRFAFGGSDSFSGLIGREDELQERVVSAVALLDAESAEAGVFPVVLDPSEAGVFIHEAFGHLSEADGIQNNPSFRERLTLGTRLGAPILNVTDDPGLLDRPGSYIVDDEGVLGQRTELIREGTLSGRLHSRETAAAFDEPLSGNMRAVDAHYTPIVRMSNIFIEPGTSSFDDMVASIENGYYLVGAKGGQTTGDQFTFGAQWGFRIRNGRLAERVRDINMSGELFGTLGAISMIGDDVSFAERGGCGKGMPQQLNSKSGKGAPHIKIDTVTIGGIR